MIYSKAMLFVSHDKSQFVITHFVLNQRMRSYNDINLMCRDSRKCFLMLLRCELARKEADADSRIRQKP